MQDRKHLGSAFSAVVGWCFPLLFITAIYAGISKFAAEFAYPPQMPALHLILVICILSFSGLVLSFVPFLPLVLRTCAQFTVFVFLALIDGLCFFSNMTWGDNISPKLIWNFIAHDGHFIEKSLDYLKLQPLLFVLVLLSLVPFFYATHCYLRSLHIWFQRRASASKALLVFYSLLIMPLISTGVVSNLRPEWFRGEPITWSLFQWPIILDVAGEDRYRREAVIADALERQNYPESKVSSPKNVVIIMLDSLRADRLPIYGYQRASTPYLSKLQDSGKLNAVKMAFSTCSESFCGIASTLASRFYHKIAPQNLRLHEILKKTGYKNHFLLAGNHSEWAGLKDFYGSEVDYWYDYKNTHTTMHDDESIIVGLNQLPKSEGGPAFFFSFLMSTHVLGERFDQFRHFRPDDMKELMPLWSERSLLTGFPKLKGRGFGATEFELLSNNYDNGVMQGDWVIGRILETLREKNYLNDAIVVVLGDHGESLGQHDHVGHNLFLYQENIRIPLLIWTSDGRALKNDKFASQVDVATTILDYIGLPRPTTWDGRSLFSDPPRDYSVHQTRRGKRPCAAAVQMDGLGRMLKLIECIAEDGSRTHELFELSSDPAEFVNLWGSVDEIQKSKMNNYLEFFHSKVVNTCRSEDCTEK